MRRFANDEVGQVRRHLLGPDPLLEPRSYRRSTDDGDRLFVGAVNNLPSTVGGGGVHADAKLPRFREEDFHLLAARGPIEGADVADWPVQYGDLEAHSSVFVTSCGHNSTLTLAALAHRAATLLTGSRPNTIELGAANGTIRH
jgi:gluconate 2-dehydrogenase alpha chain